MFWRNDDQDWIATAGGSGAVEFTQQWPLVSSPTYVLTTMCLYVLLTKQGQKWMRNREPFGLRKLMIIHNAALVAFSTFIFTKILLCSFLRPNFKLTSFMCEGPDPSIPCTKSLAEAMWWWHVSKLFDLMDTMYLVLRKRNVSLLHSYHHTSVLFLSWVIIRYLPGGSATFGPMMNSFIHMVMYTYYGLSAIGPHMQKYLWWKIYLTKLQMVQFVLLFAWTVTSIFILNCHYPLPWMFLQVGYSISLLTLFINFYYQAYLKKRKIKVEQNGVHCKQNGFHQNGVSCASLQNGFVNHVDSEEKKIA